MTDRRFPGKARGARLSRPLRARRRRAGLAGRAPAAGDDALRRTGFPIPPQRELALSRPAAARTNAAVAGAPGRPPATTPRCASAVAALGLSGAGARLVLVDGRFAAELSRLPQRAGVWFGAMAEAMRERPDLAEAAVAEISGEAAQPFAALNAAFFADGYVLSLEPGVVLDAPIEIIHLASGASEASFHTRSLAMLGAGSRASIVETYAGRRIGPLLAQRRARRASRRGRGPAPHRRGRGGAGRAAFRASRRDARGQCASLPVSRCCSAAAACGTRRMCAWRARAAALPARRRVPRRRQRRGEYRHDGRSRRARRADQRTGQGRRGRIAATARFRAASSCARARRRPMRASRAAI